MNKKLILCDLDGTLLNSDHKVSDINKQAIKDFTNAGNIFCIATGRSWNESKWVYKELGLTTPLVNTNGSHIHSPNDKDFKDVINLFDNKIMNDILNSEYVVKHSTGFYAEGVTSYVTNNVPMKFIGAEVQKLSHHSIDEIDGKINISDDMLSIIIVFETKDQKDEFVKLLQKYEGIINWWGWSMHMERDLHCVEINTISTKADGLKIIADYYDVDMKNTFAFGDQRNDLELIKKAATGYAMDNAQNILKDNADVVLEKTNNDSGVGIEILNILKK